MKRKEEIENLPNLKFHAFYKNHFHEVNLIDQYQNIRYCKIENKKTIFRNGETKNANLSWKIIFFVQQLGAKQLRTKRKTLIVCLWNWNTLHCIVLGIIQPLLQLLQKYEDCWPRQFWRISISRSDNLTWKFLIIKGN